MKVLVLTTQCPFISGGAEVHARGLLRALLGSGCTADLVTIPFFGEPPHSALDAAQACRLLEVSTSIHGTVDRVIGLKFPAYLIPHPNKVLWIIHQYRRIYELFETEHGFAPLEGSHELRAQIHALDLQGLLEARHVYANSVTVAKRLQKFCQVKATPLYHPPESQELFYCASPENYFYFPSRLSFMKRQELALEALSRTQMPVQIWFSGASDAPAFERKFWEKARSLGVSDRIRYLGYVSEAQKREHYARSLGVLFPPFDEDYGYVTLEAQLSSKPVITCTDSGGPLEFVRHRETGLVCLPDPISLAQAMDELWSNAKLCQRLGQRAREFYMSLGIHWRNVVDVLMDDSLVDLKQS